MKDIQIGFIGGGNMAYAIAGGLVKSYPSSNIHVSSRTLEKTQRFYDEFSISHLSSDNNALIDACDVVILSVKPQMISDVLADLRESYHNKAIKPLIISVAAGVTSESIADKLNDSNARIVRVMPNTPSLIGEGMSGIYTNARCSEEDRTNVDNIFSSVGECVFVDKENDIHIVTGISGSGPAYFFYFIESLIQAGIAQGLTESQASKLALQTAKGSSLLAHSSEESVSQLRKNVTSPNGTTEQGVLALKNAGIEKMLHDTVAAAANRSIELSQ